MSAPRFAVGERVRCVDGTAGGDLVAGQTYVVEEAQACSSGITQLRINGLLWSSGRFEPVDQPTPDFLRASPDDAYEYRFVGQWFNFVRAPPAIPAGGSASFTEAELASAIWAARDDVRAWVERRAEGRHGYVEDEPAITRALDVAWSRHEPAGSTEEAKLTARRVFEGRQR